MRAGDEFRQCMILAGLGPRWAYFNCLHVQVECACSGIAAYRCIPRIRQWT